MAKKHYYILVYSYYLCVSVNYLSLVLSYSSVVEGREFWEMCIYQKTKLSFEISSVQLLSHVRLFATPFPFHTDHGVLKQRILKWLAIPFSSGPHFVRTLHHDLSILGGPTQHGS